MGQYSYSQPSSSSAEVDITALLEEEAQMYADDAQMYADDAQSILETEIVVQEETRFLQTQLRQLEDQGNERGQRLLLVEKSMDTVGKDVARVRLMLCLLVVIGLLLFIIRGVALKASKGTLSSSSVAI